MNFIMMRNVVAENGKINARATQNALKRSSVLMIMLKYAQTAKVVGEATNHPVKAKKHFAQITKYAMD